MYNIDIFVSLLLQYRTIAIYIYNTFIISHAFTAVMYQYRERTYLTLTYCNVGAQDVYFFIPWITTIIIYGC